MKSLLRSLATAAFTATAVWLPLHTAHAAPPSAADAASIHVENFTLTDEAGKVHTLHDLIDAPAVVIIPQLNGDPVSRETIAAVEGLKAIFGKAKFFALNSSPADTPASIAAEAKALNATIPFLDDDKQAVARNLRVTQTGEVLVINPIGWKVVYRGPASEAASADPTADYLLLKALTHVMGHRVVEDAEVEVKGTPITLSAGG